jgi:5-methylcytosine-specific restriction endonuclease McrA
MNSKYGRWTVLSHAGMNRHRQDLWNCVCECGVKRQVSGASLRRGSSTSCGCYKIEKSRLRPYESAYKLLKFRCLKKQRQFELTYEDFIVFVKINKCHYCGDVLVRSEFGSGKYGQATRLDRKNPEMGYTKENCVTACWPCNRMKQSLSYDEFVERIYKIYKKHRRG